MGQHAQAIREKHTARNVTLIVLAVLIVLLAIAAVFGMQLYKQAKSVKAHELCCPNNTTLICRFQYNTIASCWKSIN